MGSPRNCRPVLPETVGWLIVWDLSLPMLPLAASARSCLLPVPLLQHAVCPMLPLAAAARSCLLPVPLLQHAVCPMLPLAAAARSCPSCPPRSASFSENGGTRATRSNV